MGDDKLKVIAAELITQVRKSVSIDWTLRESARAKIGSLAAAARSAFGLCFAQPVCLTSFALRAALIWLSPASPSVQSPRSFGLRHGEAHPEQVWLPAGPSGGRLKKVLQQAELLCADWV